jgi:restriction endonuclease Mrr
MQTVRYQAPRTVAVEGEIPLLHPSDPAHKQVQEVWTAKVETFDLSDPEQKQLYALAWQQVTDGTARISESQVHFDQIKGRYLALLRYSLISHRLPL